MKNASLILIALGSLQLLSVSAQAEVIGTSKDWKLEKVTAADSTGAQVSTCTAVTSLTANKITYRLEVIKEMKATSPLQILVRSSLKPSTITAFNAVLEDGSKKKFMLVALAGTQHQGHDFYQIPQNTETLVAYLKKASRLRVSSAHAKVPGTVDFSLKGSTAMIDALQKNCNGGLALTNSAFESVFVPSNIVNVDPTRIALEQASAARTSVFAGFENYQGVLRLDKAISDLNNQFAPLVNERVALKKAIEQTIPNEQAALSQRKSALDSSIVNGKARVQAIDAEVPRLQAQVPAAQAEQNAAQKEYDAVAPEHDRLDLDADEAYSRVDSANREISTINSDISNTRREISDLRSESSTLNSRLSQLARDVESARREYDIADSEARRFDADREYRDRLSRDSRYQNALRRANDAGREAERIEREIRPLKDEADRLDRQVSEYERAESQARAKVKECQSGPGLSLALDGKPGREPNPREPGQPRPPTDPSRPERPGQPSQPETPRVPSEPLPPRRDCSRELADYENAQRQTQEARRSAQQAESRYNDAKRRQDSAESEARSARNEADRISSSIASEVRDIASRLQDRVNIASRNLRNAQDSYNNTRSRLSEINSLIPQQERLLSRLQNDLQTAQADLANAQRRYDLARQALSSYDARVGYAAKVNRFNAAIARLNGLNDQIASLQSEKANTLASIKRMEAELVTNAGRQQALAQELAAKQTRLVSVQAQLDAYDKDKEKLTAERSAAVSGFETAKAEFKTAIGL